MCAICGIMLSKQVDLTILHNQLEELLDAGQQRGRDSWGYIVLSKDEFRSVKGVKKIKIEDSFKESSMCAIGNLRAEPTTEYVSEKTAEDIQPFVNGDWAIVHNGTIANDKELIKKYHLQTSTAIDSAVIPALLVKKNAQTMEEARKIIEEELVGSYALAIINRKMQKVLIMCNYKPVYFGFNIRHQYWVFASQPDMIAANSLRELSSWSIQKMEPYSSAIFDLENGSITCQKARSKTATPENALVVCSGGLDSTVAAAFACKFYKKVKLIHFLYDCKAQQKEKIAIMNIAEKLRCEYEFISTDFWTAYATGSRLTNGTGEFAHGDAGVELAYEWVYARNTVFLSMAIAYAEAHNYDSIILGTNLEESSSYSDNEPEFIRKFNELLPNVTNLNNHIQIVEPVGSLMKHEIVKMGLLLKAPLEETWSCYANGDVPCSQCGPCRMKIKAFEMNGYELSRDQKSWEAIK